MEADSRGVDNVKLYLDDIGKHPLLDKDQEFELGSAIQAGLRAAEVLSDETIDEATRRENERILTDGEYAREVMINSNLRLVVSIAKKFRAGNENYPLMDRIQEGNQGLMRAVMKFNPELGYKFSTYANWWIRQAIDRGQTEYYESARIPLSTAGDIAAIARARTELLQEREDDRNIELIAAKTGIDPVRVRELRKVTRTFMRPVRLNMVIEDESSGKGSELENIVEDASSQSGFINVEGRTLSQEVLQAATAILSSRELQVLQRRYWDRKTLDEVGREFGLTRERIRQIERLALSKLRNEEDFHRKFADEVAI